MKLILASVISVVLTWLAITIVSWQKVYPPRSDTIKAMAILEAVSRYKREYGEFPIEAGGVILDRLVGGNPKGAVFLEIDHAKSDSRGRIVNPHGIPYIAGEAEEAFYLVSFHAPSMSWLIRNSARSEESTVYVRSKRAP